MKLLYRWIVQRRGRDPKTSVNKCQGAVVYHVLALAGNAVVARAVLQVARGCVTEVLVYNQANHRRGIASTLYHLIEADLGRPLVPSRIPSRAGQAFWDSRRRFHA